MTKKMTTFIAVCLFTTTTAWAQIASESHPYPVMATGNTLYSLTNTWLVSNTMENYSANQIAPNDQSRGMVVRNGIMYFPVRETNLQGIGNGHLVRVDGATGEMLAPIDFAGTPVFTSDLGTVAFPFNDLNLDGVGNLITSNLILSTANIFQIWHLDTTTPANSQLLLETQISTIPGFGNYQLRIDYIAMYGDIVNGDGFVLAMNGNPNHPSWNELVLDILKWRVSNGVFGELELIQLDTETPGTTLYNLQASSTARIHIISDNLFYLDTPAWGATPVLVNMDGVAVDGFFNINQVTNPVPVPNTALTGLTTFSLRGEYFIIMSYTNTVFSAVPPASFRLYRFADANRNFADITPMWVFPARGMGNTSNPSRTHIPFVEVNEETDVAYIYLWSANNGYGRFEFNITSDYDNLLINEINFPDPIFRNWVATQPFGQNAILTDEDIATITHINIPNFGISDLTGIGFFTSLQSLNVSRNQLTSLDISGLTTLAHLDVSRNLLSSESAVVGFSGVWDGVNFIFSPQHTIIAEINEQNFPCENFRNWLLVQEWGRNGLISDRDIEGITSINVAGRNISDLTGIHFFTNLRTLDANNNQLISLDVSTLTSLGSLSANENQLTSLDVSALTGLQNLNVSNNQLTSIDVSNLTNLRELSVWGNRLTALDVSNLTNLESLSVSGNQLTTLDLSNLTNLRVLNAGSNPFTFTSLDVSALTNLTNLNLFSQPGYGHLTSINVSGLTNLREMSVSGHQLTTLDVSGLTSLEQLNANNNQLTTINASGLPNLWLLQAWDNQLTSVDISGSTSNLQTLNLSNNRLTSIDTSGATRLGNLRLSNNYLTSLDVTGTSNWLFLDVHRNLMTDESDVIGFTGSSMLFFPQRTFWQMGFPNPANATALLNTTDSTLIIRGTGDMQNFNMWSSNTQPPWAVLLSYIRTLTIEYGITSIGTHTFMNTRNLTSVTIPNSVTRIGNRAFADTGLDSITISSNVEIIEGGAFGSSQNLMAIYVDAGNPNFTSADGVLFNRDKTTLVQFPAGKQGAYSIPNNVTYIGELAFLGARGLTSINIPNSVTSIGNGAFAGCTALATVSIPNSVISIGEEVFVGSGLTSVTIGSGVTSIGTRTFTGSSLTSVVVKNTTPPALYVCYWDTHAFFGLNLSDITLFVPFGSRNAYENAEIWRDFNIVEVENEEEVGQNYVIIMFSAVEGADYYIIIIFADAEKTQELFRVRINADGSAVVLRRGRSGNMLLSHIFDGLDSGTQYFYSITAYDSESEVISVFTSNFTTLEAPTSVPEINLNRTPVAFYTITGVRLGQKPQSGIFIILYCDGSAERVMR